MNTAYGTTKFDTPNKSKCISDDLTDKYFKVQLINDAKLLIKSNKVAYLYNKAHVEYIKGIFDNVIVDEKDGYYEMYLPGKLKKQRISVKYALSQSNSEGIRIKDLTR